METMILSSCMQIVKVLVDRGGARVARYSWMGGMTNVIPISIYLAKVSRIIKTSERHST
jgi:hypothetical protein